MKRSLKCLILHNKYVAQHGAVDILIRLHGSSSGSMLYKKPIETTAALLRAVKTTEPASL